MVGAATGFGDWSVLFQNVSPAWMWRAPAGAIGAGLYYVLLQVAAREFVRLAGLTAGGARARLVLVPALAAAVVAAGAEVYGQGAGALGLALALGCTLVVGLTLFLAISGEAARGGESTLHLRFNPVLAVLGLAVGAAFVAVVGPGLDLSTL